jgi:hypothetical protein
LENTSERRLKLKKGLLTLMVLGGAATLVGGTLASFDATVTNSSNTFQSGTLVLKDTVGATACLSSSTGTGTTVVTDTNNNASCPADLFGSLTNQKPGGAPGSITVVLKNDGTINAGTFTLTPGACSASQTGAYHGSNTAGFCGKLDVTVEDDSGTATCIFPAGAGACAAPTSANTLASLASGGALTLSGAPAAGASKTYKFTIGLDSTAGNDMQGLTASMPVTWKITQ